MLGNLSAVGRSLGAQQSRGGPCLYADHTQTDVSECQTLFRLKHGSPLEFSSPPLAPPRHLSPDLLHLTPQWLIGNPVGSVFKRNPVSDHFLFSLPRPGHVHLPSGSLPRASCFLHLRSSRGIFFFFFQLLDGDGLKFIFGTGKGLSIIFLNL